MFNIFRECADRFIQKCRIKRKLTFAILGLDDAGKTTTAKGLSGEIDHADTSATVGFDKDEIKLGKYEITLFDLGGGKKIRDIWKNYLAEIHGIIFVVDSSTNSRMEETKQVLGNLLAHPSMTGKPMLLLANKQDQIGALDELDICEILSLETLVNRNHCPCRVESCSASSGTGKRMDPNIVEGIMWLCNLIDQNYDIFNERIETEMKAIKIQKAKEAAERKERVRLIREEREKQRIANGQAEEEEQNMKEDENLENGNGNPFKRLNSGYFSTHKETGIEDVPSNLPAVESLPSSSSSHFYSSPTRDTDQLLPVNINQNNSTGFLSNSSITVVSPKQDNLLPQRDSFSKGPAQRPNRPLPTLIDNNSENHRPLLPANEDSSQMLMKNNSFMKKTFLQPIDSLDGVAQTNKVKKKKKKLKKNNVAPISNELVPKINSGESTLKNMTHLSFVTQPTNGNTMAYSKPSEQTSSNDMTDPYAFSRKWNRVEELPYMEKLTVEDDDDDIIT